MNRSGHVAVVIIPLNPPVTTQAKGGCDVSLHDLNIDQNRTSLNGFTHEHPSRPVPRRWTPSGACIGGPTKWDIDPQAPEVAWVVQTLRQAQQAPLLYGFICTKR